MIVTEDPALQELTRPNWMLRQNIQPLIRILSADDSYKHSSYEEYLVTLCRIYGVEELAAAVNSPDERTRSFTVRILGRTGEPAAVAPLIGALDDQSRDIRLQALWSLRAYAKLVPIDLIARLLRDEDRTVRERALGLLGYAKTEKALEMLAEVLKYPDFELRRYAAEIILYDLAGPWAVIPLIEALQNDDLETTLRAAYALGQIGDSRATLPLIEMLKSRDSRQREFAAEALGEIRDVRSLEALKVALGDTEEEVRFYATRALEKMGTVSETAS